MHKLKQAIRSNEHVQLRHSNHADHNPSPQRTNGFDTIPSNSQSIESNTHLQMKSCAQLPNTSSKIPNDSLRKVDNPTPKDQLLSNKQKSQENIIQTVPDAQEAPLDNGSCSTDKPQPKKLKLQPLHISSIIEICTTQFVVAFEGNVLVTYGPGCNKNPAGQIKASIVHVDMVDSHGQMTITVNINNKLIDMFLSQLLPGASVRLTNFIIKKKNQYERVKDGESTSDTATLTVPKNHLDVYATLQQLLPTTTSPLLLFKNIVCNGAHGTHLLKSTLPTFVDELNDDCSKASLQNLASSNIQGL
ncbi:hypothetical protein SUGI_0883810 [Cryptomeria japonica]|nr:hypothetical protein SUGI_0883810 [Cryptomeria japonica]